MYKNPQDPDPQTSCKRMTPIHVHLATVGTDALKCNCRLLILPVVPFTVCGYLGCFHIFVFLTLSSLLKLLISLTLDSLFYLGEWMGPHLNRAVGPSHLHTPPHLMLHVQVDILPPFLELEASQERTPVKHSVSRKQDKAVPLHLLG